MRNVAKVVQDESQSSQIKQSMKYPSLGSRATASAFFNPFRTKTHGHFTLTLEGLREQGSLDVMKDLHGFLHGMQWIMFHGILDFVAS